MAITRFQTCGNIINRVAVEVGLAPATDPFSTNDPAFRQLGYLLTTALQELMLIHPWAVLIREFQYTTGTSENGPIDLDTEAPDFAYMIPQTGWERSGDVPLLGPVSPQGWTYLLGRDLAGSTIYASFRFSQGNLHVYPSTPMPDALDINFEYVSRNIIAEDGTSDYKDEADASADTVVLSPHLVTRLLKLKFLESKGFGTQQAKNDYNLALDAEMGRDNSAGILSVGRPRSDPYYLDGYRNVSDTSFGS